MTQRQDEFTVIPRENLGKILTYEITTMDIKDSYNDGETKTIGVIEFKVKYNVFPEIIKTIRLFCSLTEYKQKAFNHSTKIARLMALYGCRTLEELKTQPIKLRENDESGFVEFSLN